MPGAEDPGFPSCPRDWFCDSLAPDTMSSHLDHRSQHVVRRMLLSLETLPEHGAGGALLAERMLELPDGD